MTLLHKLVTGLALAGTTLAPTIVSANTFSVGANAEHASVVALGSDNEVNGKFEVKLEAKKDARINATGDARMALLARLEALQRLMIREFADLRATIKTDAGVRGQATTTVKTPTSATSTITAKARGRIVADVQHLIGSYRQTMHAAEVQYDKSISKARVTLRSGLSSSLEARDKEGAFAAFDAYLKAESEADVKFDAARAAARGEFMADLKVLFG